MSDALFRVYLDPAEIGHDGYPHAWHGYNSMYRGDVNRIASIKDLVREQADHRCVRCGHPYRKGEHGNGEWSACGTLCTHLGPFRVTWPNGDVKLLDALTQDFGDGPELVMPGEAVLPPGPLVEAQWRILTVHHLNGIKHDCRWWNLVALCQRCHLSVQTRVILQRPYNRPHSEWFKPYVAGYYASLAGEEITREEAIERMDEILSRHAVQLMLGLEVEERL